MNIRETVEDLMYELNMAIDEVNTMRDIHNNDTLQPADHWDKETLHDAQIALRDFVEKGAKPLLDHIEVNHHNNQARFAATQGTTPQQVTKWVNMKCIVVDGVLYSPRRELNCVVSKKGVSDGKHNQG